jgi:glycosyltransferase involved in cell wall biosynthesis
MPHLSLLICTYNRADLLPHCLLALAGQQAPGISWELIVVDNNSTDNTATVIDAFLRDHPEIDGRRIHEARQGLSHARNRAAAEARADWVLYLDDDARAAANLLHRAAWLIRHSPYPIVGGVFYPWYHYGRPHWYRDDYASNALPQYSTLSVPPANYVATGGIMLWQRELLQQLGGFDPRVGMVGRKLAFGEETYLQARARERGIAVAYDPELVIYHVVMPQKLRVDYFFRAHWAAGRDAVIGQHIAATPTAALTQLAIGLGSMALDLIRYTPRLLGAHYYRENWLIDVFRKVAKRLGSAYTALLTDRP